MMIPDILWKPVAAEIDQKSLFFPTIIKKKLLSALERNKMSHLLLVIWILSFRWVREGIARSDWLLVRAKQSSAPHARSPCKRAEEEEESAAAEEEEDGTGSCQRWVGTVHLRPPGQHETFSADWKEAFNLTTKRHKVCGATTEGPRREVLVFLVRWSQLA